MKQLLQFSYLICEKKFKIKNSLYLNDCFEWQKNLEIKMTYIVKKNIYKKKKINQVFPKFRDKRALISINNGLNRNKRTGRHIQKHSGVMLHNFSVQGLKYTLHIIKGDKVKFSLIKRIYFIKMLDRSWIFLINNSWYPLLFSIRRKYCLIIIITYYYYYYYY